MKDDKLTRFLNAINFDIDFTDELKDASVKEVLLNKKINKMTLVLNLKESLKIDTFKKLYECSKTFKGADEVRFKFIVEIEK